MPVWWTWGKKTLPFARRLPSAGYVFPLMCISKFEPLTGRLKKGAIVEVARLAGIMGAKKTPDLIPLCHGLMLDKVDGQFAYEDEGHRIEVTATAKVTGKTGVEMEAPTAVSVACLTIYDMTKALSHDIQIESIQLMSKAGGNGILSEHQPLCHHTMRTFNFNDLDNHEHHCFSFCRLTSHADGKDRHVSHRFGLSRR